MKIHPFGSFLILAFAAGCLPLPAAVHAPTEVWTVFPPGVDSLDDGRASAGCSAIVDTWIGLDSVSLRPALLAPVVFRSLLIQHLDCGAYTTNLGTAYATLPRRIAVVTTFQSTRYHPGVVRAMGESPDALSRTASAIAGMATGNGARGVLLDFGEMSGEDLPTLMEVSRAIADSIRARAPDPVGIMVPTSDSAGYPARTLARIADVLLVRLFPEHGVGNPPGPIVSPSWYVRQLGARAGEVGVNRIVAGVPADGVLWSTREGARRISYMESLRLAQSAGTPVVRDPASGNLHAVSTRDGWELWVADHELVMKLIAEGRRIGVTRFALFGLDGADSRLWQLLPQLVKR
jgi:spore germination protein YaaH